MSQDTSKQRAAVPSDDTLFAIMDEYAALDEDHFQQLDPKPLEELFDAVEKKVQETIVTASNGFKDESQTSMGRRKGVEQYLQINRVLLGLQHWANDIKVENESPLSITEKDNDGFNSLASMLRTQFLNIMLACSVINKATERTKQESIDNLDQLVRHLRRFVAPLRTFLEDALGLGNAHIVRMAGCGLDPARFGKPREEITTKDNPNLLEKISESLIDSKFDTGPVRKFAPNGLIRGLVLPNAVRDTLAKGLSSGQEVDQDLVDYVVFRARKLFAICIKLHLEKSRLSKAMILFKENSISDDDLPLEETKLPPPVLKVEDDGDKQDDEDDWDKSSRKSLGAEDTTVSFTSTKKFDPKLLEMDPERKRCFIESEQWVFLTPVFSTKNDTQDLKQSSVLPFPRRDEVTEEGGFGIISRIEIQEGHIDDPDELFGSKMPSSYALKQIRPNRSNYQTIVKNWTKEIANLRTVTSLRHPAILRFVTAFRRGDGEVLDHYLIYEWADGGNLRNFWNSHESPKATPGLVEEVVTQLLGLADALCTLHYSSKLKAGIVHGNLKPENILRFKPEGGSSGLLGILKIGDWSLSKEKDWKTAQENNASLYHASIKYEPPEISEGVLVVGRKTLLKTRSRLYDIWSFGCIMLEFIVWLAEGAPGLVSLDNLIGGPGNKQFWEKQRGDRLDINAQPQIRISIRRKMDVLDNQAACRVPALRNLLHFVRDRALVIHLPTHLAALDPVDLKGLEPGDLARLESASVVPWSTSSPRDEQADVGLEFSRAQTTAWINSINSYDSENPHAEAAEIIEAEEPPQPTRTIANLKSQSPLEEELTREVTGPNSAPAPTVSLKVVEPEEPPRAKATELLKTMRQVMILAADQAAKLPLSATSIYNDVGEVPSRDTADDRHDGGNLSLPHSFLTQATQRHQPTMSDAHALLVGVDLYLSDNSRPDTNGYPVNLTTLKGCVRDVEIIRDLLQTKFGLDQPRILTSSQSFGERRVPSEPENKWPTLNNIEREIYEIYDQSRAGDMFLFFFSGHGARLKTTTESPENRTTDPSLMTADYCCSQPAIRGWQLNNWLRDFHNKGVRVVVLLDSCHSGGAWRTGRQIRSPEDWTPPPNLPADIAAVQGAQRKPGSRKGDLDMDWDVNPEGMTLMTACRADQHAEEIPLHGKVCGAFTGILQAYLQTTPNPSTLTYRVIRDHVASRIPPQEPQVFGQDRLQFFGNHVPFSTTPTFIQIRDNAFYLPIGKAHGVSVGAEFTTFPPTPTVILSAQEVQDFESKVEVERGPTHVLEDLTELVPFRWSYSGGLRILVDPSLGLGFREQLESSLRERFVGDIQIAESNEHPIDNEQGVWFWLMGAEPGNVDILGPEALLGSKGPVRGWKLIRQSDDSGAADSAVALAHLARFDQILRLKNHCSQDSRHFTITLDPDPEDGPFHHNQKFTLTFQSQDTADLFFTALIFSSGFHIKQLFPEHDATKLVCPNGRESFEFRLTIPDELKRNIMEGEHARYRDILRIIITRGKQLSLESVELPDIWNAYEVDRAKRACEGRLGKLESNCKWWICDYEMWLC